MPLIALVPAAGSGERFSGDLPKQLVEVRGWPLLAWTLERLRASGAERIVVALPPELLDTASEFLPEEPGLTFVAGGATRQESVELCLAAAASEAGDLVLVHDGVRPAVAVPDVQATVEAASQTGAAVLGRPVIDTLKRVAEGVVEETVDRARLFRAETPQVFRHELLTEALASARRDGFEGTDEASLVERLPDVEIRAVAASAPNPKLTEPGDLTVIEALLAP